MRNIKMYIKYDGSRYKGWQKLKGEDLTIQSKIEKVLSICLNEEIEIIASGRTDAGVHAIEQIANFNTNSNEKIGYILDYLYEFLPEDIVVSKLEEINGRFHSRYNAISKEYVYKIYNDKRHDPFLRKHTTHIPETLDIKRMKKAAEHLIGEHDFTSFKSSKAKSKKSNVRIIHDINIEKTNAIIEITVHGNGFLHNMVRIIVGTLIEAGASRMKVEDVKTILESKERALAGPTAKAQGLYLKKVNY